MQQIIKPKALDPSKFVDPDVTAKGERRATVSMTGLSTLWFNTGTLCNIECANCYIESSPTNDRLAYITQDDVRQMLDQAEAIGQRPPSLGFTGGEPFMNPAFPAILDECLSRGYDCLVLTNAMKPLMRPRVQAALRDTLARHGTRLSFRVSLDHWRNDLHDEERGSGSFSESLEGMRWLRDHGATLAVAARKRWNDAEADMRAGFATLFETERFGIDARDPTTLVIFPEMDARVDVPEITVDCWRILNKSPDDMMCASSRMVVKRRGQPAATVVACTLLPYEPQFDMGSSLAVALQPVKLNHPHCAKFCVLGGGSCKA